jgi:microcompartment protein CcmL/EutN
MKSLGFVEVQSVAAAVDCLDLMCKAADVSFVTWERKLGGRLVTIIVTGDVSDVTEAVECVKRSAATAPCASFVIANPHEETIKMVELSASRLKKKN